jgi:predicted O-methyltransferase YrrM
MTTSYEVGAKTGLLGVKEIELIKKLVNELRPYPTIVNIGAGSGTSALAMLEERDDLLIWSIDNEFPTTHRYTPGEKQNLIDAGFWESGSVIQVWGESQLVGLKWNIWFDMIFVDGNHKYEPVKRDIELWMPWLKPGGYALFHDYGTKQQKPKSGVKDAVDELLSDWEFVDYQRVTWAIKKPST